MIHLDLTKDLAKVRAAFDAGQLQMQTDPKANQCFYAGPCAIGAMLTPEQRLATDDQTYNSFDILLSRGWFTTPKNQASDFTDLQEAHDHNRNFGTLLQELEAKYAN